MLARHGRASITGAPGRPHFVTPGTSSCLTGIVLSGEGKDGRSLGGYAEGEATEPGTRLRSVHLASISCPYTPKVDLNWEEKVTQKPLSRAVGCLDPGGYCLKSRQLVQTNSSVAVVAPSNVLVAEDCMSCQA